ncbi:DUF2280 domain-containing protein [Acinetobacter haemolyticus]|uniref:DUF2280 domain-containing protein n=1 Tax=Acinetobacter haemolyticus TaxID=29430 RepID=UPI000E568039|nr:DUF2280 domain-containing protein [Acinetobacter haemolyticus]NAS06700.1 DUF2280 domain-containing protein [Acinetobacter haemolyticus]QDJ92702.1 DUF2280 domain-containing protein [Acinetobacter haemolyticus]
MAALREPVKIFIVQSLACFETPQQVADAVKQEFNIEIGRQQVALYDPTKATGKNLSKKLKALFEKTREEFKSNVFDIPLANKAYRINELQKMYDSSKNKVIKQNIIKQVKDEMHGHSVQLLDVELKRLEIQRIKEGEDGAGDDPTPVTVTINVVDASKKDAEHQSDA